MHMAREYAVPKGFPRRSKKTLEPWVKYIQSSCMAHFRDQPMGVMGDDFLTIEFDDRKQRI